jgi:predicted Zn finger-like uncharacterized protein
MIRFACPSCSATFSVGDEKAGKSGKCPKCLTQFLIPALDGQSATRNTESASAPELPPAALQQVSMPAMNLLDPALPVEIDPCPKCQTKLSVSTSDLGNDVECPYCKTVFKSTKFGTRPPAPPPPPKKKSSFESESSERRSSRRDDDDDDTDKKPARSRRSRKVDDDDDDDDDPPPRRRRRSSSRGTQTVMVSRIGVLAMGKITAMISFVTCLIYVVFICLASLVGFASLAGGRGGPGGAEVAGIGGMMIGIMIGGMFAAIVIGFIYGVIIAAIYNLAAGIAGGIEFDLDEV